MLERSRSWPPSKGLGGVALLFNDGTTRVVQRKSARRRKKKKFNILTMERRRNRSACVHPAGSRESRRISLYRRSCTACLSHAGEKAPPDAESHDIRVRHRRHLSVHESSPCFCSSDNEKQNRLEAGNRPRDQYPRRHTFYYNGYRKSVNRLA